MKEIRKRYHTPRIRTAVNKAMKVCLWCRIRNASPKISRTAPLPLASMFMLILFLNLFEESTSILRLTKIIYQIIKLILTNYLMQRAPLNWYEPCKPPSLLFRGWTARLPLSRCQNYWKRICPPLCHRVIRIELPRNLSHS